MLINLITVIAVHKLVNRDLNLCQLINLSRGALILRVLLPLELNFSVNSLLFDQIAL